MSNDDFESPLFKRLSKTDANKGSSHVAGILIPTELRPFFPALPVPTDAEVAPSVPISVIMVVPGMSPIDTIASYQFQTRTNKRKPESRLTGGIEPFRQASDIGDFALFERSGTRDDLFRITLVTKADPNHAAIEQVTNGAPFGILDKGAAPVALPMLDAAIDEIEAKSAGPFTLFDASAKWVKRGVRMARAKAFPRVVIGAYDGRCAMCGPVWINPKGGSEIEAAHIAGRGILGTDDARNGLALCRRHHWAFDNRLIGLRPDGMIVIASAAGAIPENAELHTLTGLSINPPADLSKAPHPDALAWASAWFDQAWPNG